MITAAHSYGWACRAAESAMHAEVGTPYAFVNFISKASSDAWLQRALDRAFIGRGSTAPKRHQQQD